MPRGPSDSRREPASRPARRLLAICAAAVGLYVVAVALLVYAFGVKQVGYFFFDGTDIPVYFRYALLVARGARAYVDFPVEYPPLALAVFRLAGTANGLDAYTVRFALAMLLFGGATAAMTAGAAARLWRTGARAYVAAGAFAAGVAATGALLANRYDVTVALVVATCALLLVQRWAVAAAFTLGLGFALKLVPAILLPLVLLVAPSPRKALHAAAAFAVAAALPFLPHAPDGVRGLVQVLAYHGQRPLQIESVLATPHWIAQLLGLVRLRIEDGFGAQNVGAPGAAAIARASGVLGLAMLGVTYAAIWRRRARLRDDPSLLPLAMAAVLVCFVTFGKVLSPQFLIWLLPCVALLLPERRALGGLLLLAMVLTQIEFPASYPALTDLEPAAIGCVVARNLALLAAFALSIVDLWRLAPREGSAA